MPMKLKKEIATLLLATTLLTASLTACQQTPDGGNKIDNTTPEITTVKTTPQETTTPEQPSTNQNPFDFSLSELGDKLGCYVSQEYGNNLEVAMRNDDAPFPIRFEYEEYKSTEFKMITQQGDDEFSITLPLKKPCRFLDWYSSFQDDLNGYVFVFDSNYASMSAMPAIELVYLLKTTDGGKTWDIKQYQDPPSVGGRDYIEGAHFFTDQIGFFMARLCNVDDLVDRTYWTFDGGSTWELMSPIQYPDLKTALGADKYNYSTEIADLELIDDTYYMTVIIVADGPYSFDGDYFLCVKYSSKDLKNWTLEKSPAVSLERYIGTWYDSQMPPDDLTITSVSDGKIECQFGVYRLGLYDLTVVQEDGKFIFTDKNGLISGTMQFNRDSILLTIEESNIKYYQKGESWSFTIEDTIVRTIYSSSNSDGSDKVVCKYEYSKNGSKVYLQIDAWDQTLVLPFTYKYITEIKFAPMAATIIGDKGFFVHHPDNDGTSIEIFSFIKGSDEITEQTIAWNEAICQNQIFCDFIDDENGYIFVTEEIDAPGFSRGAEKVAHLYKTQDGGKTWASVNCDNIPYISMRESLILAKFVTEDIAIIAGHLFADDFNFHERTYITKDGGLSWIPVDLSAFADLFAYQVLDIEAYDLQYIDDTYYLYVEDRGEPTPEGVSKPCYIFTSTDGVEWNYLKKIN